MCVWGKTVRHSVMSLNLLKINEQNSLRAWKDLLIIVNCKMRDLTQRKGKKWMGLIKMMGIAIVQWPSRSSQIEVIIAKQHRKINKRTFLLSLPLKWIDTNDLGSMDDEQRVWECKIHLMDSYLMTLMIFNSLQGACVKHCNFCPNYRSG